MSLAVQRRRGTTAEHASFTGLAGELTVDTDKKTVVVHDGSTVGGIPLAREDHNQRLLDPFKPGIHSGLSFSYGEGIIRADNLVVKVEAGTLELVDAAANYIEVTAEGIVATNLIGYTAGSIPLFTVTTLDGAITLIQDDRCFFNVAATGGGSGSGFGEISDPGFIDLAVLLVTTDYAMPV